MKRLFPPGLVLLALLSVAYVKTMAQTDNAPAPPVAKKIPRTVNVHGTTLSDDYFWMRDKKNPEVIKYLEAENAYTDALTKNTAALQEKLYKEMLSRIKETDTNVPWPLGGYLYYTRTEAGKQYATWARRKGSMSAPEEVLLDLNEMVKGHPFMSVGDFEVSDDTNVLAYSTDSTGYREYTLNVKDLRTGAVTKIAERVSSVAWANDNKTLFYVVDNPVNKNPYRLYRRTLGQTGDDELIYEEKDEMFGIGVERSRSHGYIFLTSGSHTTSEVRYLSADKPADAFRLMLPREAGARVLRGPPRRHVLHTHERSGLAQLQARLRARLRPAPRELEGGHPAPRGRDDERRRVVQRLLRRQRARQRHAASYASSTTRARRRPTSACPSPSTPSRSRH